MVDGITPVLVTAAAYDTHLVLIYSEDLWPWSDTPTSVYTVMVNGVERSVSAVSISNRTVALTLASAVATTDEVTVSYTVVTRPIRDGVGNRVAALTDRAVTTSAPGVISLEISSTPAARKTYGGGEVIEITVTFSENVTVTGTPQLLLTFDSAGSYEQAAPYVGGSGTKVLVFRYTVAEGVDRFFAALLRLLGRKVPPFGDEAPDGLSITADALQMHDGTIRDSDDQDAILVLDELTDVGDHKVDGIQPYFDLNRDDWLVVNGATLTLHYDERLDENSVPASSAFVVTVGGTTHEVTDVSIDKATVTLTLLTPVGESDSDKVKVGYTVPTGTGATPLQDVFGNKMQDYTPLPDATVSFGVDQYTVDEGQAVEVTVRLSTVPERRVEIPLTLTPGDNVEAADYSGVPDTVVFESGDTEQTFSFSALTDQEDEEAETVTIDFGVPLPTGIEVGSPATSVVTIGASGDGSQDGGGSQGRGESQGGGGSQGGGSSQGGGGTGGGGGTAGQGGGSGGEVAVELTGYLENPGPNSFQSGIGVLAGWVCAAETVEIALGDAGRQVATYGTERLDTVEMCGDSDNGFGLLFNWNLLGDGEHEVVAYVDDVELARATVTVTTLGEEFLQGAEGVCVVEDFPRMDESVTLVWQQSSQNFVLADGPQLVGIPSTPAASLTGVLENPSPYSFQSGIGLISGWVCEAETVEIRLGELTPQVAAYGTERRDTERACGDSDNGFGLPFNWNLLGDGEHEVVAWVDGEELGRTTVQVTTLGEEFAQGVEGMCVAEDFPRPGETVMLEWQQASQNFVITDIERAAQGGEED